MVAQEEVAVRSAYAAHTCETFENTKKKKNRFENFHDFFMRFLPFLGPFLGHIWAVFTSFYALFMLYSYEQRPKK